MRKFWREITTGLVLLAATESAIGSLPPGAALHQEPNGGELSRHPALRLVLPSEYADHLRTPPQPEPDVTVGLDGITGADATAGRFELQVTSTSTNKAAPSALPGAAPPVPTPDQVVATLRTGSWLARVGPQALSYDSLIHKDRTDQGAVVALEFGTRTLVKGFGVQSGERGGYQRLLGSDRASYAANGVVAQHRLPSPEGGEVNLVAAWLSGSAHAAGTEEETDRHSGDAWSIAADSALLEERLLLHFEYAGSHFDWQDTGETAEPGIGQVAAKAASAYRFGTEFHSENSSQFAWHLGTQLDQISPRFGSLANPTLGSDWRRLRTYGALNTGEWRFDLSLAQRRSNLDDNPATATERSRKGQFTAAWTPSQPTEEVYFGRPSYKLTADYGQSKHSVEATTTEPAKHRKQAINLKLQTEFAHADWLWGVRANGGEMPGKIDADEGIGVRTLALHLYGDIAQKRLRPTLSWQRHRDQATGTTDERWRARLSSTDFALRDNLKAGIELAYQHRLRSDIQRGDNGFSLGANLLWQVQRPATGRSGLTIAVSGNYRGGERSLAGPVEKEDYRFMLSLSTSSPGSL